ncbi:MAG: glycerate kinase [Alphaproteobacteria bacterium]|nr:glycerate kinase [Alphaproteobacteria bacterium]
MKVVVAPNAFKGSLTAPAAAAAMAEGVARAVPDAEIVQVPVADGGDGLIDVAEATLGGELRHATVTGPRQAPVQAAFCLVPSKAFAAIEMAEASGLALLPEDQLDPRQTTSYGTGELIAAALDAGAREIAVGLGGSATNDGGIGVAAALGVRFLDGDGAPVEPVGGALARIRRIDMAGRDPRIEETEIEAICDVDNPLLGPTGAAHVFGPQKGASPDMVAELDAGLANLADVIARDLGRDVRGLPGAGAAGGLGAGLHAFLGATLRRGVDVVLDLVGLDGKLEAADLVLTAEGQIDAQTLYGKAPAGVAEAAMRQGIPCLAIAGSVGDGISDLHGIGIDAVFSLCSGPMTLADAMEAAPALLSAATEQAVRGFMAGGR